MVVDIQKLEAANAARWANMHLRANRIAQFDATAKRLCAYDPKARYQEIARAVWGAPDRWWFVALVHEREAGGPPHFDRQLGQGDPLRAVSVHEPKGRGPFFDHATDAPRQDAFYRASIDALQNCGPYAARWTNWTIGGVLTLFEEYNGLGYASRGVPSAYVWSGSDQYTSGKYVADHVYSRSAVDVQEGCAPLLSRMMAIDPTIQIEGMHDDFATPGQDVPAGV